MNKLHQYRALRMIVRVIALPILWVRTKCHLWYISHYKEQSPINIGNGVAYVRSDFWLNGRSANGAVAHTIGIVNALRKLYDISVYTIYHMDFLEDSITQREIAPSGIFSQLSEIQEIDYNKRMIRYLCEAFKLSRPVFVYQRYARNNYAIVYVAKKLGIPVVTEYNGSMIWMSHNWGGKIRYEKITNSIELTVLKYSDWVVCNAQALKDELVERGVASEHILVIPNGVDPEKYSPEIDGTEIRKKYKIAKSDTVVTFVGTFGPWHGADILASAVEKVVRKNENVKFLFVGNGDGLSKVENIINKTNMLDKVIFTGLVPQNIAPLYLAASDILVSPQIPNPDGTPFFGSPTKLFEYLSMGKAVVASRLDQMGEILSHDYNAILFTPGDSQQLADDIVRLSEDKDLCVKLGRNGRKLVVDKYTWDKHVEIILKKLIKKRKC